MEKPAEETLVAVLEIASPCPSAAPGRLTMGIESPVKSRLVKGDATRDIINNENAAGSAGAFDGSGHSKRSTSQQSPLQA
jgi:hypothetical protein